MIQLLLIVCIILCLIILFLKTKENFNQVILPACTTLKATGGNKGIKLTWIKPHNTIQMYYILLFSENDDKSSRYNVYLYNNTNTLLEFHIKNIPNNTTYNVGIMYKSNNKFSPLYKYKSKNGNPDIITDKNSPLNFSDFEDEDEAEHQYEDESNEHCISNQENNVNTELQHIINFLTENKNINQNYNINLL